MRKKELGVTLMELLVVVAIVGILASIAIPSYRNYVMRANRADAKAALLSAAGALERCFTRFNSYAAATCTTVVFPMASTNGNYQVTATTRTPTAFTLTATPQGGQVADTECGNFIFNNANSKTVSTSKPPQECWGR